MKTRIEGKNAGKKYVDDLVQKALANQAVYMAVRRLNTNNNDQLNKLEDDLINFVCIILIFIINLNLLILIRNIQT